MFDITMPDGSRLFYGNVTLSEVPAIIYSHLLRRDPVAELALGYLGESGLDGTEDLREHPMMKGQLRIALRNAGIIDSSDIYQYIANDGYNALYKAVTEMTPQETLEEVTKSGLRGPRRCRLSHRHQVELPGRVPWTRKIHPVQL